MSDSSIFTRYEPLPIKTKESFLEEELKRTQEELKIEREKCALLELVIQHLGFKYIKNLGIVTGGAES